MTLLSICHIYIATLLPLCSLIPAVYSEQKLKNLQFECREEKRQFIKNWVQTADAAESKMDDDTISIQKKMIVIDKDAVSTQGHEIWTQGRKGRIDDFGKGYIMEYGHIIIIIMLLIYMTRYGHN